MSYPPPGFSSLPQRPPPSTADKNGTSKPAFSGFVPRNVNTNRTTTPSPFTATPATSYSPGVSYSAAPDYSGSASYSAAATPAYPDIASYSTDPSYAALSSYNTAPQINNPFVPVGTGASSNPFSSYDAETEAQIQQWQSTYTSNNTTKNTSGTSTSTPTLPNNQHGLMPATTSQTANLAVRREGGGKTWNDPTLLEWNPAHFRIFVGNLAGEVTDDSLLKAFSQYPSVSKARVVREKRTTKSKGFGFVSFAEADDYFNAAKDMQGKYIGSHPVQIKRAQGEIKATAVKDDRHKRGKGGKGRGGKDQGKAGGHSKVEYDGIQKAPKTKGGLKVLG